VLLLAVFLPARSLLRRIAVGLAALLVAATVALGQVR
jgi:hypothetical protein